MTVMGRQASVVYLAFQAVMPASARLTSSSANRRASSARLSPCCWATVAAMAFQWPGGVAVPVASFQNCAICVWSAVRVVLLTAPILSTWFTASAHAWLVRAGGPTGRNWLGLLRPNGVRLAHWGS